MKKRTGKTTRIIDRAIQNFFNEGYCYLYDESRSRDFFVHKQVFETFKKRLTNEHNILPKHFNPILDKVDGIICYKVINLNYGK